MIKIIEQSCISKSNDEYSNEDGIFLSDKYVAVIDGATSKNGCTYNNKSGGQIVKDIIKQSLSELKGNETYFDAVYYIQEQIEKKFPAHEFFHASASAVIYSVNFHQVWFVGDCQALIGDKLYDNKKEIDSVLAKARAVVISALLSKGKSVDELRKTDLAREAILPLLKYQSYLENTSSPYGYLAFNNSFMSKEILSEKGVAITVPQKGEIILASDGYPVLCSSLEKTECILEKMIQEDPLCCKGLMGTKGIINGNVSFDDRTYVRFEIY